jgi:hypothetical protein
VHGIAVMKQMRIVSCVELVFHFSHSRVQLLTFAEKIGRAWGSGLEGEGKRKDILVMPLRA